jgi:glycine/D-amino acid oxidase-like deaminating enzyme
LNQKNSNPGKNVDFLLVGQGIAGSILAHRLMSAGQRVFVIDQNKPHTSSRVAAGMINPVTGRKYVKSWMIESLLEEVHAYYRNFEQEFEVSIFKEIEILRILKDTLEEERWILRSGSPGYESFISDDQKPQLVSSLFTQSYPHGIVKGSAQINFPKLLEVIARTLAEQDNIIDEIFDHGKLTLDNDGCSYGQIRARHIVFCEGAGMARNPFFQSLPMFVNKGEILKIHLQNYPGDLVAKRKHFTIPLADGLIWFGALNSWVDMDKEPSPKTRETLEMELEKHYRLPYKIHEHIASFRPAVKDRRPLLGTHSENHQVHVFNGMGTKGASLVPYFSKVMVNYLVNGEPLPLEVNISRFNDVKK